jgi:hypothetical protein
LAWHDLITLYRFRHRVLCTDSVMALTRGNPIGAVALLNHLDPNRGSFTGISPAHGEGTAVIGQMVYTPGDRSAHVSFLTPGDNLDQPGLPALLESLAVQAGSWGACHLLAEVEENSPALELVRRGGFNIYGRQTIWQFTIPPHGAHALEWQPATPSGENLARSLYQQLVPPLVQTAEPFAPGKQRLLYRLEDELLAYAEISSGSQGIYVQPIIHPGARDSEGLLAGLLSRLPPTNLRPVYLAVRSYQAWLDSPLARLGGQSAPQQALLVKHLAVLQRTTILARQPVREVFKPDASVPVVQHTTIHHN